MKISKKVADVMIIGGTIGFLSSLGAMMYVNYQARRAHPIEQAITEMKDNFDACAYEHNKPSCQQWRQQYKGLETKLAWLENDQSYQQFLEHRDRNQKNSIYALGVLGLSVILTSVGGVADRRRHEEEFNELKKEADSLRQYTDKNYGE